MTEPQAASLPPELELKLKKMVNESDERYLQFPEDDVSQWSGWLLSELRAAALVAQEHAQGRYDWLSNKSLQDHQALCGDIEQLQAELAALRQPAQKTTIEEAAELIRVWLNNSGHWGAASLKPMAAAIDKLRERPLPVPASGMTVEERIAKIDSVFRIRGGLRQLVKREMEAVVAEAVAAKRELWEAADKSVGTYWMNEFNRLEKELFSERERHAAELEAEQAKYKSGSMEMADRVNNLQKQIESELNRHAAELAKVNADIEDNNKIWLARLKDSEAEWRAACESLECDVQKAKVAAYEGAARSIEKLDRRPFMPSWIAEHVRQLAAAAETERPDEYNCCDTCKSGEWACSCAATEAHDPPPLDLDVFTGEGWGQLKTHTPDLDWPETLAPGCGQVDCGWWLI